MSRLSQLWRTSTFRLTAIFVLIFVGFAVSLLGYITYQSSVQIQHQQAAGIDGDIAQIRKIDERGGFPATIFAIEQIARRPGPGLYHLAAPNGQPIAGNIPDLPPYVLLGDGTYSFDYTRPRPIDQAAPEGDAPDEPAAQGTAVVRSVVLGSGLRLVVGRDVLERRGFTSIIFQSFLFGAVAIIVFSIIAGLATARRVLRRIDTINTTFSKIVSGNLSERVPLMRCNDEFDNLATNLNATLDRIEQLMQGLKEVTDNVAHDLKTPLTRLRNQAEAALREGADGQSRERALETTITESDKLIRTFNALLMIARAEAGAPSGAFADLDISAAAADLAELYGPVAEDEGIALSAAIEPAIRLRANRELIGQALVNLIENAMKYGAPAQGSHAISLTLSRQGGRILLVVADNGAGIAPEDRQRVLERFVRLEASRTEPGSGLGLSLVSAVARLHKGEFRIEDNAPGVRAVIDLPA